MLTITGLEEPDIFLVAEPKLESVSKSTKTSSKPAIAPLLTYSQTCFKVLIIRRTGEFAPAERCQYKVFHDNTWPSKYPPR